MGGLIVHEWIEPTGGAERVVDAWAERFPDADIFCLWDDDTARYEGHTVRESWLASSALRGRKAPALPFMSRVWRHLDVRGYDWVLASSHSLAHHVGRAGERAGVPVYVYAHTPPRYLWAPELDDRAQTPVARLVSPTLRRLDRKHVSPKTHYAANSAFVRERAAHAWGVDAEVIYPPVELEALRTRQPLDAHDQAVLASVGTGYLVAASRFAHQKRLDLAIRFAATAGQRLVVCGRGPEEDALRQLARELEVDVEFVINPSDALMRAIIRGGDAFLFPPVEDFGIVPVEAMALGVPVIVNPRGGAAESLDIVGGGVTFPFDDGPWTSEATRQAITAAQLTSERLSDAERWRRLSRFDAAAHVDRLVAWMGLRERVCG